MTRRIQVLEALATARHQIRCPSTIDQRSRSISLCHSSIARQRAFRLTGDELQLILDLAGPLDPAGRADVFLAGRRSGNQGQRRRRALTLAGSSALTAHSSQATRSRSSGQGPGSRWMNALEAHDARFSLPFTVGGGKGSPISRSMEPSCFTNVATFALSALPH